MKYFNKITKFLFALTCTLIISCGGGGDDGPTTPTPPTPPDAVTPPGISTLIFPDDDEECTEGEILNDTQSSVTFEWNASTNTDSYEINLTNLNTDATARIISSTNSTPITLLRGIPYEWFVISKASGTVETAQSVTWRFYNAGEGVSNYAPFPATAVAPARGLSVTSTGSIALEWSGSDVDNDITEYEVFFGINTLPATSIGITTETSISAEVIAGTTYYWRVITKDSGNNTSSSEIFEFKTN